MHTKHHRIHAFRNHSSTTAQEEIDALKTDGLSEPEFNVTWNLARPSWVLMVVQKLRKVAEIDVERGN